MAELTSELPAVETPQNWLERNFFRLLLAIAAAGLIPRLILGNYQFIGFDGWWHLFIATQDRWLFLLAEWKSVAHPPLFYPLLRAVTIFGHSHLIIRSIGILCGSAGGVVVGVVAAKIYRYKASALLVVAAYTFAWSIIDMNCDLRAYPIAILFVLLAFNAYLDWAADPAGIRAGQAVVRFGVYSLLGLLTEYYVIFFLAGCAVMVVLRILLRPTFRAAFLESLRRYAKQWLFSAVSICLLFLMLFAFQMTSRPQDQPWMQSYYWSEDSPLGLDGFLLSNLEKETGYFTPFNIDPGVMLAVAGLVLLPALIYFALVRRDGGRGGFAAEAPFLVVALLAQMAVLSLVRQYPFGGEFRHQSILAPFVFLTGFLLLDRVIAAWKIAWARNAAFLAAAVSIAGSFAFGWARYEWKSEEITAPEYAQFHKMFPAPGNIYADSTSGIYYFGLTHNAKWTDQDRLLVDDERIMVYQVKDGQGHATRMLRNKRQADFDLREQHTYDVLGDVMRQQGLQSVVLYYVSLQWNAAGAKLLDERIHTLAPLAGLECGRYDVGLSYAFVEFRLRH